MDDPGAIALEGEPLGGVDPLRRLGDDALAGVVVVLLLDVSLRIHPSDPIGPRTATGTAGPAYDRAMGRWDDEPGVVVLPDGRRVRGAGVRRRRRDAPEPEFAVYLLGRDPATPWPHRWVRWRDFGLPHSTEDAVDALREAHRRAAYERVEIACGGGVGRTGSALAVLAVLGGLPATEAVAWVRRHHHPRAVETRRQRRWVVRTVATLPPRTGRQ